MKSVAGSVAPVVATFAVLGLVPAVLARGGDTMDMDMGNHTSGADQPLPDDAYPPTYFALADHRAVIYAHIVIMVLTWIFILPVSVMLSLARSRYTLHAQFGFLAANALGVVVSMIYNSRTPDLYPNNAHHKIAWIATVAVSAQVFVGLLGRLGGRLWKSDRMHDFGMCQSYIPVSTESMAEHESRYFCGNRLSHDSGQGTEPNTESLRGQSMSSSPGTSSPPVTPTRMTKYEEDDDVDLLEAQLPQSLRSTGKVGSFMKKVAGAISSRLWKIMLFYYHFIDRTILILGFITLCTGIITFARFFQGHKVFSGLAHWIKGGIFSWLGIFTLGRWAGSFGEIGWAWNVRPKQTTQSWRPSAEFVESALIFTYGTTNIFLEHLGNAGGEFSAQDLEHISITVLFIGGGLCGMLVESSRVRDLLNTTVSEAAHPEHAYHSDEERAALTAPRTYAFPLNPLPALVILLLGIMMSSHTQESMISSMVHKQWGNLLTGASFSRALTYVLLYLKPPKSIYPSRPPTELLTSFGLIAGGIMFMASSSDTVAGMIHYSMDAMFMYTITMGFVGLIMSWVIICIALKGWAVRKETGRPMTSLRSA